MIRWLAGLISIFRFRRAPALPAIVNPRIPPQASRWHKRSPSVPRNLRRYRLWRKVRMRLQAASRRANRRVA